MAETAYPTDAQIAAFVATTGVVLPSGYVFTNFGSMASEWWEERTGFQPFLQDASPSNRIYNPPGVGPGNTQTGNTQYGGGRILNLQAAIANSSAFVSVNVQGYSSFVLGQDFWLTPVNAPSKKRPYTRIEFQLPIFSTQYSVTVSAQWGWSAIIPDDAWQAILRKGAELAMLDILEGLRTATLTVKQGDETFTIDPGILAKSGEAWGNVATTTARRYEFTNWGIL